MPALPPEPAAPERRDVPRLSAGETMTMPHPDEWADARKAFDAVTTASSAYQRLSWEGRRAVDALGNLLGVYDGYGEAVLRGLGLSPKQAAATLLARGATPPDDTTEGERM